jgi:hypothetical protein
MYGCRAISTMSRRKCSIVQSLNRALHLHMPINHRTTRNVARSGGRIPSH